MNDKFMKALSEGVAVITKPEAPSIIRRDDNNAILKMLGTEYTMELRRDMSTGKFIVAICDSQDRMMIKTFSELEVETANHNVLLCNIEQCILSLKEEHDSDTTSWLYRSGWSGNHDKPIENAKCLKCGYIHPTVYDSLENLSKYCPGCGRKVKVN